MLSLEHWPRPLIACDQSPRNAFTGRDPLDTRTRPALLCEGSLRPKEWIRRSLAATGFIPRSFSATGSIRLVLLRSRRHWNQPSSNHAVNPLPEAPKPSLLSIAAITIKSPSHREQPSKSPSVLWSCDVLSLHRGLKLRRRGSKLHHRFRGTHEASMTTFGYFAHLILIVLVLFTLPPCLLDLHKGRHELTQNLSIDHIRPLALAEWSPAS